MLKGIKNLPKRIKNFLSPMWRTIWIALAGQGIFLISVLTMSPLRMWENPVINYNLYYVPILAIVLGYLFYRCCIEENESRGYLFGFFAALFAWPLIGEVANIPVDKGLITQFSDFNIKLMGAYFYVASAWALLHVMWRTGALKKTVCVFFMTFLSIWTFELYMDSYSSMDSAAFIPIGGLVVAAVVVMLLICLKKALGLFKSGKPFKALLGILVTVIIAATALPNFIGVIAFNDPLKQMAPMANLILWASLLAAFLILVAARKTESLARKTLLGCIFYIVFALILMSSNPWKEPQTFYVKYEATHIDHEIAALQQDKETLARLFDYMANKRMLKAKDYKYMYEHGIITIEELKHLVTIGRIDGKGLEFLTTRGIITLEEFQAVLDNKNLSNEDMQPLVKMGIAKKNDRGVYELQRKYIKIKEE